MSEGKAKPQQNAAIRMRMKHHRDIVYSAILFFALAVGCVAGLLLQKCGVIAPESDILVLCIGIFSFLVAAVYFIRTRAEGLEITDQTIYVKYSLRKMQEIPAENLHCVHCNILGEMMFYNDSGQCILIVMRGLSGFDQFKNWLQCRNIAQR